MLVKCNSPYRLVVDDVEWSPVSSSANGDMYVLTTSGSIVIYVDNERVFFFRNTITADFVLASCFGSRTINGETGYIARAPHYLQTKFVTGMTALRVIALPDDMSAVSGLSVTCSQENAVVTPSPQQDRLIYDITGFDLDTYLSLKVGNVLVAFVTPRS